MSHLKRAGIDVSVRLGCGDYADLEPQHLVNLELVPMCRPGLTSNLENIQSLAVHPLLSDNTSSRFDDPCGWSEWLQREADVSIKAHKELYFGNGLLALEAALSGQGVLFGMRELLLAEVTSNKLEVLINRPMRCAQAYYVVSASLKNERSIARQFSRWLFYEAGKTEASTSECEFI